MKFPLHLLFPCAVSGIFALVSPAAGEIIVAYDNGGVVSGNLENPWRDVPFEAVDWSDHVQTPTALYAAGGVQRSRSNAATLYRWGTTAGTAKYVGFKVAAKPGHRLNLESLVFDSHLSPADYERSSSFFWGYRIDADNDGTFEQDWKYGTVYSEQTHGESVYSLSEVRSWPLPGVSTAGTIEFGLFGGAPTEAGVIYAFHGGGVILSGTVTLADGSPPDPLSSLPEGILGKYEHATNYYINSNGPAELSGGGKLGAPEASGVAYDRATGHLYMVGDEGYAVARFTRQGELVDSMHLDYKASPRDARALDDPEGITYLGNNTFGIADERDNMVRVTTYDSSAVRTLANLSPTSYPFGPEDGNTGVEGVAYDPVNGSIWGVKESDPTRIYEMRGVPGVASPGTAFGVVQPIARKWITRAGTRANSSSDQLSDIFVIAASNYLPEGHPSRDHLLLLARKADKVVEITRQGRLVSSLDISSIGRHDMVEGMTMDDDGVLYLVSEGAPTATVPEARKSGLHVFTPTRSAGYTLQLLHLSDGEAGLLASRTAPNLAALVDAFADDHANTLILSGGDNFIPSPFLNAGTDPSLNAVPGIGSTAFARADIAIHNAMDVEASAIGNHEWDLGSNVFADAFRAVSPWPGAGFPHISANLDFSGDPAINPHFVDVILDGGATPVPEAADRKGKIVPTAVVTKGGEKIGLVGITTQLLGSISSPSGTKVKGNPAGDDMDLLASQVQPYLDELAAEGVNKIILLSHLQQIANEQALATRLHGVDIILAAGSNTRLGDGDDVAVAFPGHAATFAGPYPLRTAGTDGKPVLIVNTDNEYTYLGRLVVDFTAGGEISLESLDSRTAVNGAYASTPENVAAAWGTPVESLAATAFAAGTRGAAVKAITDAVQAVISAKDGQVHGFTTVYLEGERAQVRSEETNLGNITADANAGALRAITGSAAPIVSLKNGGGIRAQIGAVSSAGGSAIKLPPPANPAVGKPEGGISRLDIENALRFDNKLIAFETTPAGLKAILEHGVAAWPNQGRFPQVGGVSFSWNPALPAGSRVVSLSLIDDAGGIAAALYKDGAAIAGAPAGITMVTLNFLANNGDGYPMKANGVNFRYLLADNTLGPPLDEAADFTVTPSLPPDPIGEQRVFADYLAARHGSAASAYGTADTPAATDRRIQKLDARGDTVLPYPAEDLANLNKHADALRAAGLSPLLGMGADALRGQGRAEVLADPGAFGLYTAESIQDLRGGGVIIRVLGNEVKLGMPLLRSSDLEPGSWVPAGTLEATLPKQADKAFFRVTLPE